MEFLIIYLLKSAGLLALFYLAYIFLLKNDTSFKTNRIFLFSGIIAAFLLPSMEFTRTIIVEDPGSVFPFQDFAHVTTAPSGSNGNFDWWQMAGGVYLLGLVILSIQFALQVLSLSKIIGQERATKKDSFLFISTKKDIQPFSFFSYIVYNPSMHPREDLELILEHEKIHARQWHSADVLISTMATGLLWFFPLVWLYRKAMVQNLEYLADRETVAKTESKKAYQQALVKVFFAGYQPALTNPFYQSFIKKRIMMLNKTSTTANNIWKTTMIIPFLVIFIFGFQVKTEAQVTGTENPWSLKDITIAVEADSIIASQFEHSSDIIFHTLENQPLFIIDGEIQPIGYNYRNLNKLGVKTMSVLRKESAIEKYGEKAKSGVIIITTGKVRKSDSETIKGTDRKGQGFTYSAEKIQVMQPKEGKASSFKIIGVGNATFDSELDGPHRLYVVDGKLMHEDFNPEEINVENIKNIAVLKGSGAIEKYGDKAANGVIEIYLKK